MKLVDITIQKRPRGDTVRPAVSIPNDVWNEFKLVYSDKNIRDNIVSNLLIEQLNNDIITMTDVV